ncbi:rubisco accumulation factor 1, chloroplastic [Dorcoceras hygrometricum]|uniref:Rubisco accumulation factor 1, chloroplastic n=1 Tax=Dorcoceras hygrometricum TaxID=472368 RepID=A0A2Z7D8A2_9LAMI|nr:rubisco accumulation factor 1, chloroplastic [Dorcoceras hygrometricum]
MLALTPIPLSSCLSTPFVGGDHHLRRYQPPYPSCHPKSTSISAIILPSSSSSAISKQKKIYQPYRPPPSSLPPPKYRSLDTTSRLDILTSRLGLWFEYAPLITTLYQEGFISTTLEEITGIPSLEQNRLVVASQVRDSLVESCDADTVSFFDTPGSPEILYEIRILNTEQRVASAKFIIKNGFEGKKAGELAKSMKDFPRRYAEKGWESFDADLPGDCLGFMYFRQAHEHKSASLLELSKVTMEKALEMSESERAKQRVLADLEGTAGGEGGDVAVEELVRVPVVRMSVGEVAQSSIVVVLPVCKAEGKGVEVEAAPWECGMVGDFGVVEAEKGWTRWVVLPGWEPVAVLKRGGVAVAFKRAGDALQWRGRRRDAEEQILVVADRGRTEVALDDAFYLVVSGGNGRGEEGLRVEKGLKLKESGVVESLGTVVLIVRPPTEDYEDQLGTQDWD